LILDTRRLFCRLLRTLAIETVCDVGSMDGTDALLFRRFRASARILAFEPNPRNFALMTADARLRRERIGVLPFAASDRRGTAPFFVVDADYTARADRARRGLSSLYQQSADSKTVQVPTVRLDEVLAAEAVDRQPIALWIDTEGAAFEAIRGATGVLAATRILHVEVETKPIINTAQKLFADVERALTDVGFVLFATDQRRDVLQFNALFVRADSLREKATEIRRYAARERVRRTLEHAVLRLIPARLRAYLGLRLTETRCR